MTRATFLADENTIRVDLPKGWGELEDHELELIYRMRERYEETGEDVRFHVFRHLTPLDLERTDTKDGRYKCRIATMDGDKVVPHSVWVDPNIVAIWMDELDWIDDPGYVPVRLQSVRKCHPVNAKLHDVTFDTYLMMENLYQGFLTSQNLGALSAMYRLLYPSDKESWENLTRFEIINILCWVTQVKLMFSRQFRNLFKPSNYAGELPDMLEIMNNEIRALTGGDVTKESIVREVECWRALTELDFKAKEAEEMKKQQKKLK